MFYFIRLVKVVQTLLSLHITITSETLVIWTKIKSLGNIKGEDLVSYFDQ